MSDTEPRVRPFADLIRDHNNGRAHNELSELLHELVAAVKDTGKKGSLTLRLTIEPMKGDTGAFTLVHDVSSRVPKPDRKASIFYVDGEGNLSRSNPDQPEFEFLRDVSAATDHSDLKEAN